MFTVIFSILNLKIFMCHIKCYVIYAVLYYNAKCFYCNYKTYNSIIILQ